MPPETMLILVAIPFGAAFVMSLLLGPGIIGMLRRRGVGQTISEDGPESHQSKAGTPTMGGLIIIAGVLASVAISALAIIWSNPTPHPDLERAGDLLAVVLLMCAYAIVGMIDDYLTIHPVRGVRGIGSKSKAAIQFIIAIAFVVWLATGRSGGFLPALMIEGEPLFGGIAFWVFAVLYIVGMTNFVNITDGLDGLAAGLTAIACAALMAALFWMPGSCEISLVPLVPALAGACIAFLWFNANPAKVFMGDTGSMAIGAGLAAVAVLTHREVLLVIVGLVFVLDGLSTAVQWAVFKFTRVTTGTGRRVFKKSPIHHHFELSGWPEQLVVVRFWIVGVIAALIGVAGAGRWW